MSDLAGEWNGLGRACGCGNDLNRLKLLQSTLRWSNNFVIARFASCNVRPFHLLFAENIQSAFEL